MNILLDVPYGETCILRELCDLRKEVSAVYQNSIDRLEYNVFWSICRRRQPDSGMHRAHTN